MTEEEQGSEGYEYPEDTVYRYTGIVRANRTSRYMTIPRFWGFEPSDEVMIEVTNLRTGEKVRAVTTVIDVGTSSRVTIPAVCRDAMDLDGFATLALMSREGYNMRLEACDEPSERARIFGKEAV